jgi:hypothetical protein
MKAFILTIFIVSLPFVFYAQTVKVKLKLDWQKEKNVFAINGMPKMDSINIPYLLVSYSNTDSLNYYFYKLTTGNNECPQITNVIEETIFSYHEIDISSLSFQKYKNNHSTILIEFNNDHFARGWQIQYGNVEDRVNLLSDLNDFHDIIESQNYLNKERLYQLPLFNYGKREYISLKDFLKLRKQNDTKKHVSSPIDLPLETIGILPNDVTSEGINTKLRNLFLFLKRGEVYTDRIPLMSFYLAGGTYEFCILLSNFPSSVTCTDWDAKTKTFSFPKIDLPKEVNGYKLYTGEIKGDIIVLSTNN